MFSSTAKNLFPESSTPMKRWRLGKKRHFSLFHSEAPIHPPALSEESGTKHPVAAEADRLSLHRQQCLVSDENSACLFPVRHKTLSGGDVKVCLTYDSGSRSLLSLP